jgi:hypothetical protein
MPKKRKNFFPLLLITLGFWVIVASIVIFTSPQYEIHIILFFLALFLALFLTSSLLLAHTRRGFLVAAVTTLVILLKVLDVANIFNIVLLVAIAAISEYYFIKKT